MGKTMAAAANSIAHRFFLLFSVVWCLFHKADDFFIDATSIKMDYLPIGDARVDPILNNECVSDHVHTFYGPQSGVEPRLLNPNDDPELGLHTRLVNTPVAENTGNVEENKSLYWHPTVYRYNKTADTYHKATMAGSSAYYVWETGETMAFPNGFRMIGGFNVEQSLANAECVNPGPCLFDDCTTENTFFPSTYCDELEVSMRLPSCWDGVSLSSPPSHTSHVAYTDTGEFFGGCPPSHPIRVPQIQLFFRIMPYPGGHHTFADGSGIFHSDYVSGWNEDFLRDLLDNCNNEGTGAMPNFFCENHLTFRDAPKCTDENTCDFADPNLIQKIRDIQPPPLDVRGTIVAEETCRLEGALPRGTCNGSLVVDPVPSANNICDEERYEFVDRSEDEGGSGDQSFENDSGSGDEDGGSNGSEDNTSTDESNEEDTESGDGSEEIENDSNEDEEEDRCKDISNNKVNFPNIGRVKARANRTCKWFREKYKNKVLKKKYCLRKVLITSGPRKGRKVRLNQVCRKTCADLGRPNPKFCPSVR